MKKFNFQDKYFHQAKKKGLVARSYFKLEEIDQKYKITDRYAKQKKFGAIDIGAAPGSWLQYMSEICHKSSAQSYQIIGLDLKPIELSLDNVYSYVCDIQDQKLVSDILTQHNIQYLDMIISDMAPNTIGDPGIDAMRSIGLLEKTLWIYERFLGPQSSFVIKIFMGPGFDEFVKYRRDHYKTHSIKVFKPPACRKDSKETYIIGIPRS